MSTQPTEGLRPPSSRSGDSEAVGAAKRYLRPPASTLRLDVAQELVNALKAEHAFSYARRLLSELRVRQAAGLGGLAAWFRQQQAVCTYKDTDRPAGSRLDEALAVLSQDEDLDRTTDQESLGIAGAIYKRLWVARGDPRDLERSRRFYLRGYEAKPSDDHGYTGINAAFVLDELARLRRLDDQTDQEAQALEHSADEIRRALIATHSPVDPTEQVPPWRRLVLIESYVGLGRMADAQAEADRLEPLPPWELETAARQITSLARMRRVDAEIEPVLRGLAKGHSEVFAAAISDEKVGLALSGGGFRAAFFHLGVLADLAERDLLRRVEVLSCVSGGSIVGAQFYLEVRHLLNTVADGDLTPDHYVRLVTKLISDFTSGVQEDLRNRLFGRLWGHLRTPLGAPDFLTRRLGALFEDHLYARVNDGETKKREISGLYISPRGATGFRPARDNWSRLNKAPVLVLNATTMNTGHLWQFTASWMGEPPPDEVTRVVDGNDWLRRMYYHEAPERHQRVRLGQAVAASACVPTLFPPLELRQLYAGRTVRLVDGGVHDNQGLQSLFEQDCNVILVSDGSGQMGTLSDPLSDPVAVAMRSQGIQGTRVRVGQLLDLATRRRAGLLRGAATLHLRRGLVGQAVDWIDSDDPWPPQRVELSTPYGIPTRVQQLLSEIRTDLDAYSDTEAAALMLSGYKQSKATIHAGGWPTIATAQGEPLVPAHHAVPWTFLSLDVELTEPATTTPIERLLRIGAARLFKALRSLPRAGIVATGSAGAAAATAIAGATWGGVGFSFAVLTLAALIGIAALRGISGSNKTLRKTLSGSILALVGAFVLAPTSYASRLMKGTFLRAGRRPEPAKDLAVADRTNPVSSEREASRSD